MKKILLKTLFIGLVFAFFGCTDCNDDCPPTNENLGKVNIYIEGNITNAEAQAKLQAQIGTQTENIYVQNTTQLTDITINIGSNVTNFRNIITSYNDALKNINIIGESIKINDLKISESFLENININGIVEANNFYFACGYYTNPNPVNIICNNLTNLNGTLHIGCGGYNNKVNFNHLKQFKSYYNGLYPFPSNYAGYFSGNFQEFNMPELEEVYDFHFYDLDIETVFIPKLKKANYIVFDNAFRNANFPLLENCERFEIKKTNFNNYPTSSISIPNLIYCKEFIAEGTGLTSIQVNQILHQFLTILPSSDKYIDLSSYTFINAAPTSTGIDDKNTLIAQGNTVFTN